MEKLLEDLDGKLKTLKYRMSKSDDSITKQDKETLERQRLSVSAISTMVNTLKETIEEKMFLQGKDEEEVKIWAATPETMLAEADQCVRRLTQEMSRGELVAKEELTLKEEQHKLDFQKRLTEQKLRQEKEADEEKRKLDWEHQQKLKELQPTSQLSSQSTSKVSTAAKMPKLVISKFTGTPQDWVRFWGLFESQIDKSAADDVTKFSYLKELVEVKVRKLIDGLPFTGEGYARARDILKKRYVQTSEVVGAYVRAILELPTIKERDVSKIHSFYETLLFNVESLQTLESLEKLDAAVRFTFDKLDVIKSELAMTNEKWSEWTFMEFVHALELWTKNNPIKETPGSKHHKERDRSYFSKNNDNNNKGCLYCSNESHKAIRCNKVVDPGARKKILAEKHLCFNCAGGRHRAAECKSKNRCQICEGKHHTSICDKSPPPREPGMTANFIGASTVVHPVVVVRINGYKFRALLDSGASHSYAITFAKQQLGANPKENECKLLGLKWNKIEDTLQVDFPTVPAVLTKRGVLAYLAKVYDPLGLISPMMLEGKIIYREICEEKIRWDGCIPDELSKRWLKWESALPNCLSFPRCIPVYREPIQQVKLHSFGDASKRGVCAAVYAVVQQESGVVQGLVAAKSRLAKTNLTIPRLELVGGHMAVNLAVNVRNALEEFRVAENIQCWLDSTVALHWLKDHGQYRQFVANRVRKMRSHENVLWRHVPTAENPADLGSRGGSVDGAKLWSDGPDWLSDESKWPPNIVTKASDTSEAEKRVLRELSAVGVETNDVLETVLSKFELCKALRIFGWVIRFRNNCRNPSTKVTGAITTDEVVKLEMVLVNQTQQRAVNDLKFAEDKEQLQLETNENGILQCHGRIQGEYPIFLPDSALFTTKVVQRAHLSTLHGGVGMVMAKVREKYWVPRLRKLAKKVISSCYGCKKFRAPPANAPPTGLLPKCRTEQSTPFAVIGVDFAGPVKYRLRGREAKSYVALFSCSLTRAVFLELLPSLETKEFIKSLKRFIARRGRPTTIYSDNGSTFIAASKWLKCIRKDEELNNFLRNNTISWRFNLSRAPWWGGQFERLIGLMKGIFYKTVGSGLLTWDELTEVLLDVEIAMNNRPLNCMEEDVQLPTLTPNSMLFITPNYLPELKAYHEEDLSLRKRSKFLKRTKEEMWRSGQMNTCVL